MFQVYKVLKGSTADELGLTVSEDSATGWPLVGGEVLSDETPVEEGVDEPGGEHVS